MKQTWRWFGPYDTVSTNDMRQAGVEGVVSALHHLANGSVWTPEEINKRQREISHTELGIATGLNWDVVESLPVSEAIKQQTGPWREHLDNYITSLRHLAAAGIETVCYNFMPVLDWTRTELRHVLPSGSRCMRFDIIDFATFDIHLLKRKQAESDYSAAVIEQTKLRLETLTKTRRKELASNVTCGLPGAEQHFSLNDLTEQLAQYKFISEDQLRSHLIAFLETVVPIAEELGMRLCCHPDDPPFPLLGLPRIMSTEAHYKATIEAVNSPANGITLCSGSLGVRADNDLPGMMQRLGDKVHFLHLRNVYRESDDAQPSFYESAHLDGATDMVALLHAALAEEQRRKDNGRKDWSIPFRPDHGQDILSDLQTDAQPGYPAIGRLKGLAELRGIIAALNHPLANPTGKSA